MKVDDSWNNFIYSHPNGGLLIELYREEWDTSYVVMARELHPEMNVNGLYWRLTGIAKELGA